MIWTPQAFAAESAGKPQGWHADIWAASTVTLDSITVDDAFYHEMNLKYRLPSLLDTIKSLAKAAAEAAATGLEVRGGQDTERVFSICAVCPYLIVDNFSCGKCLCKLTYKAQWTSFSCPEGKW